MANLDNKHLQPVAPCGINCSVCYAYLRNKNKCGGCWGPNKSKTKHCITCQIKNCEHLAATSSKFCYECGQFPCARVKQIDKRYRTKYKTGLIDNLRYIKEIGLEDFILKDKEKWKCSKCGGSICMHKGFCLSCGKSEE